MNEPNITSDGSINISKAELDALFDYFNLLIKIDQRLRNEQKQKDEYVHNK